MELRLSAGRGRRTPADWLAQGKTLRLLHRRASTDRVAERCSAPTRQFAKQGTAVDLPIVNEDAVW